MAFTFIIAALVWAVDAQCSDTCERSSMKVNFGFDLNFRSLEIDIGTCSAAQSLQMDCNTTDYGSGYSLKITNDSSCDRSCVPGSYALQTYRNRTGSFMLPIVKSCRPSNPTCSKCRLAPLWVSVFPGSPYKSAINVGVCEGTCSGPMKSCVATNKKNFAVSGPNGAVTVEQTVECGCEEPTCYREDYYESHWEVVEDADGNGTVVREKLINVGQCRGNCNGVFSPKICLPSPNNCIITIGGGKACCGPATSEAHNFMGVEGRQMSVAAVTSCTCR